MPTGYAGEGMTYSRKEGRWKKKSKEQAFDYDAIDKKSWALLVSFFRFYPDFFYDLIRSPNAPYKLELPQRIMLRVFARYQTVYITGARGIVKTMTTIMANLHDGVFYPDTKERYYAPSQKQSAALASQAFDVVDSCYPLMTSWWHKKNDRDAMFLVETPYGSEFKMYAPRGDNFGVCIGEEMAQEGEDGFPFEKFESDVKKGHRIVRKIQGEKDKTRVQLKFQCISNAASRTNPAFSVYRKAALDGMLFGEKYDAFCMDISWISALLCNLRDIAYYKKEKSTSTSEVWKREMEVLYTGTGDSPMISDEILVKSRRLLTMEDRHCGDANCIYVIGHDVAYENVKHNAECADWIVKLTRYDTVTKRDKYRKQIVWVDSYPPPQTAFLQARKLKALWRRFCLDGGNTTYLVVDARAVGKDVVDELMKPMNDGLPALSCLNKYNFDIEQPNAIRCVYPLKASRGGNDDESAMIDYYRSEYEQGNVELLVADVRKGVENYKLLHGIKDDTLDSKIALPYRKTTIYIQEVQNLKVEASGTGMREKRKSNSVQRDLHSAGKYAFRLCRELEEKLKKETYRPKSDLKEAVEQFEHGGGIRRSTTRANDMRSRLLQQRRR